MPQNDKDLSVNLPEGLRRQFAEVERRLWNVETAVAVSCALGGLLASYLLLFICDRVWETPGWVRLLLMLLGCGIFAGAALVWLKKWVWRRRDLRALSNIVQKKFRRLGDRLLGIVELANEQNHLANFSPALYHAAIHQVATEAEKFDFRESVNLKPARKFLTIAAALAVPLVLAILIVPAACWNALLRWAAPMASIPRYTLVSVEDLPDQMIVPHGETFELSATVHYRSFWKPSHALVQFGREAKISGTVNSGKMHLRIPGQVESRNLKVQIGDAQRLVHILPTIRPSLKELGAAIKLPDYLKYPDQAENIQNGALLALEGSRASFHGKISRALTEASIRTEATSLLPLKIHNDEFTSEQAPLDESQQFLFNWRDQLGLTNAAPLRLSVQIQKDAPPVAELPELPRESSMLASDVLQIKAQARDDFGVRDMGLMWEFFTDTPTQPSSAVTEVKIVASSPHEKKAEKVFTWSPSTFRIPPDSTVEVQAYARDYLPERERSRSPIYRIHVMSPEQHAEMVRQRLESMLARVEEVTRLQEKIVSNTREAKENSKLAESEKNSRIGQSQGDQTQNSKNLDELAKEGEHALHETMKNPIIKEDMVQQWSKTIQEMQKLAQQKMKEAANSLQAARQNQKSNPNSQNQQGQGQSQQQQQEQQQQQQNLAEALQKEQEVLQALQKMQNKGNENLDQLHALTLAERLRKVGGEEKEISDELLKAAPETIGLLPKELPNNFKELDNSLAKQQGGAQKESKTLEGEISRFFERTQKTSYQKVSKEMKDAHTGDELERLSGLILDNITMEASGNLTGWSKRFHDWADLLDPKQKESGGNGQGGSSSKNIDMTKTLIALLRMREKEMNLREQTGLLDQNKGDAANYKDRAHSLFWSQKNLLDQLKGIQSETEIESLQDAFIDSEAAMLDVETLLQKPQTDKPADDAEGKTIDNLSDLINLINEQAKRNNPQQSSSSANAEEMAFLMRMMQSQQVGKGKPMQTPGGGGNTAGGSTDRTATPTTGNSRGRGAGARDVSKASGVIQSSPTEFREALENYFHAIEQNQN